jgi:NADH:ubiquinone oxidoreductase subunit 5 (subunit L)/multisubunit Na+/H+ antiporter MnhA subunit
VITLGAITSAYGGVCAASQTDVKKLLAYSTMSHCGFLFILVGFGDCYITIVYLFLHGLFKASTFFCVGSFIRVYGSQDTRVMGGGAHFLWGDTFLLLLCSINLCGLPFTVGIAYKLLFFKILLTSSLGLIQLGLIYVALLSSLIYFYRLVMYTMFDT